MHFPPSSSSSVFIEKLLVDWKLIYLLNWWKERRNIIISCHNSIIYWYLLKRNRIFFWKIYKIKDNVCLENKNCYRLTPAPFFKHRFISRYIYIHFSRNHFNLRLTLLIHRWWHRVDMNNMFFAPSLFIVSAHKNNNI